MLKELHIKNYAIIDEICIDFTKGFNVFTGETGAGKSIIIGALTFLVKGRADTGVIKTGKDRASVEGVFDIEEYMKPLLDEAGIEYDDQLIVKRTVSRDGKNTISINQSAVTLSFLEKIFGDRIDIHSQKDSQFLLNRKNHIGLLDRFSHNESLLLAYKEKYLFYTALKKELEELMSTSFSEREMEFVRYDLNEINEAGIDPEEEKELSENEKRYRSAEKYLTVLNNALGIYNQEGGIREQLKTMIKELDIHDDRISEIGNGINEIYVLLEDKADELENILNSFSDGSLDINHIEERLFVYSRLKRKHGRSAEGLLEYKEELEEKIRTFENREAVIAEKEKQISAAEKEVLELAGELHKERSEKGKLLADMVLNQTKDLMLKNVRFEISIAECEPGPNGTDSVEFLVSMNKGEDMKPLKDVASGGEISRFMLALKTVFASLSGSILVIFDEIDTGVSGQTGLAMGLKMAEIANGTEVLAITHLAQVAACADRNFYIYKKDGEESTSTYIRQIENDEIIRNLAEISSGSSSELSTGAAEELYKRAKEAVAEIRK